FSVISRAKHNDMSTLQPVPPVKRRIPRHRMLRNVVRPQTCGFRSQSAAHDLLHLPFMQIYAGTKHGRKIRSKVRSLKPKVGATETRSSNFETMSKIQIAKSYSGLIWGRKPETKLRCNRASYSSRSWFAP